MRPAALVQILLHVQLGRPGGDMNSDHGTKPKASPSESIGLLGSALVGIGAFAIRRTMAKSAKRRARATYGPELSMQDQVNARVCGVDPAATPAVAATPPLNPQDPRAFFNAQMAKTTWESANRRMFER
jgi:hypothetical protein